MAGGMRSGPTRGQTLAQRSAASGIGTAAGRVAATDGPHPCEAAVHRRHCWVAGPDQDPGPWPGLVLGWRRDPVGTWSAWVVYLVGDDLDVAVQGWVTADRLAPARATP